MPTSHQAETREDVAGTMASATASRCKTSGACTLPETVNSVRTGAEFMVRPCSVVFAWIVILSPPQDAR